jgi:hypothetical protein
MMMHKVKIVLPLLGGHAERVVVMPIMPAGTLVDCLPGDEPGSLPISHWIVRPSEDDKNSFSSLECYLDLEGEGGWGVDEAYDESGETFATWLEKAGFKICRFPLVK